MRVCIASSYTALRRVAGAHQTRGDVLLCVNPGIDPVSFAATFVKVMVTGFPSAVPR